MSVSDNRDDILVSGTVSGSTPPLYGDWGSTQGVGQVAIVANVISGSVTGDVYLSEANDTATPAELFAHPLTLDPSGHRYYGVFSPAAACVTIATDPASAVTIEYSIRAVTYL